MHYMLTSLCYYVQEENCFKIYVIVVTYVSCQVGQAKEMCIAFLEALDETRSVDTIQMLLESFKTGIMDYYLCVAPKSQVYYLF